MELLGVHGVRQCVRPWEEKGDNVLHDVPAFMLRSTCPSTCIAVLEHKPMLE